MENGYDARGAVCVASRIILDSDTVLSPGAVAISGGIVIAAGSRRDVERSLPAGFERLEFPGGSVFPGLVNAHTHLQIPRLPPPAGDPLPGFVDWILRVIAWKRAAPPEEFRRNFAVAAAEALAAGTTSVGEISGPDVAVYRECPLRARVFVEGIGFAPAVSVAVLSAVEAALGRLEECAVESEEMVAPGVSPHTLYTVGPALLRLLGDLAARKGIPACLHLAESPAEMEFLATGCGDVATRLFPAVGKDVSWFRGIGMPLPEYLRKAGFLRKGLLLAHNVHLSREEIEALFQGGAGFVLCPRSNAVHGNGSPDVTHFVDAGIPFALGTDSLGSVPDLSIWEEMRAARSLYRGKLTDGELCRVLFRAATENGSALLSLPGGTLRPGDPADFVVADDAGGRENGGSIRNLVDRTGRENILLTVVGGSRRWERA
jgi:cytosine/adenosine deaminase-related metal-dependent hydrolase